MAIKWTKENVIQCIAEDKLPQEFLNPQPAQPQMDFSLLREKIMNAASQEKVQDNAEEMAGTR